MTSLTASADICNGRRTHSRDDLCIKVQIYFVAFFVFGIRLVQGERGNRKLLVVCKEFEIDDLLWCLGSINNVVFGCLGYIVSSKKL